MSAKTKKKASPVKYRGIVADARELGVSHPHLWLVLTGQRKSRSLWRRYRELKKEKQS